MARLKSATRPFSADRSRGPARPTPWRAGRTFGADRRTTSRPGRQPTEDARHRDQPADPRHHRPRAREQEQMMRRVTESLSWNNRSQEPWNHNLHYHRVIVKVIPPDCRGALDAGCGGIRLDGGQCFAPKWPGQHRPGRREHHVGVYKEILFEVDDPVATITLNRPSSLNAWTDLMGAEVRHAVAQAERDPRVVGIVLTGAGRGFCAGADMSRLSAVSDGDYSAGAGLRPALHGRRCRAPHRVRAARADRRVGHKLAAAAPRRPGGRARPAVLLPQGHRYRGRGSRPGERGAAGR